MQQTEQMTVLVTVKAYPQLSRRHGESVCVAGIRDHGDGSLSWVRLFPVFFRHLATEDQFRKYQYVDLRARKETGDPRPETYRPDGDSIEPGEHLKSKGQRLTRRRAAVEAVLSGSMCEVQRRSRDTGGSLGAFRPAEVLDVKAVPAEASDWIPEAKERFDAEERQLDLLDPHKEPKQPIDKIPYDFKYVYRCHDPNCATRSTPHQQTIIDWEAGALYRNLRGRGDDDATAVEKVRGQFLHDLCGDDRDVVFFTNNAKRHPSVFMILGVFSPKKPTTTVEPQVSLFP